jgi:hypothetical protein
MNLSTAELTALEQAAVRIGLFFRLDTSPEPVQLWGGIGPCKPGVTALDPVDGASYAGFGELGNVPGFQQLINGAAERVEFTLSGVSAAVANVATVDDADAVKNRACALGFAVFGADWQMLGTVHWPFQGVADFLGVNIQGASEPGGESLRTIKLSVGNGLTGRKRRGYAYWTDQDNQYRSPGDLFCQFVAKISIVARKVWPKF